MRERSKFEEVQKEEMKQKEIGKLLSVQLESVGGTSERRKRIGQELSIGGGRIGDHTEIRVAKAIRIVGTGDIDNDGVPDMYDCQPLNPEEDGFWGDVGRAAKERVSAEVEDVKERAVERVRGRPIAARAALKDVEREEEWEEEKRIRKERGKKRVQRRYGVTPVKTIPKRKPTQEGIEYHGVEYVPVKKAPVKRRKKKTTVKRLPARTEYYVGL